VTRRFATCQRFYLTDKELIAVWNEWRRFLDECKSDVDMSFGSSSYVSDRRYAWVYIADQSEQGRFIAAFGGEQVESDF
jgi:hypothetical protein